MTNAAIDIDQVLKSLANSRSSKAAMHVAVRDLTLKALQQRELTLEQIGKVLRSITEGATLGGQARDEDRQALSDTIAGMDDALLKAVHASNVALHRLTAKDTGYEDSNLKQALDELEKLDDEYLQSIAKATDSASEKIKAPSGPGAGEDEAVRHRHRHSGGVDHSSYASARRPRCVAARDGLQDRASLHAELRPLASGILIGMSEGLGERAMSKRTAERRPQDREDDQRRPPSPSRARQQDRETPAP